jgi:hypothetical protein
VKLVVEFPCRVLRLFFRPGDLKDPSGQLDPTQRRATITRLLGKTSWSPACTARLVDRANIASYECYWGFRLLAQYRRKAARKTTGRNMAIAAVNSMAFTAVR